MLPTAEIRCVVHVDDGGRDQRFGDGGTATSNSRPAAGAGCGGHAAMSDRRSPVAERRVVPQPNPVRTRTCTAPLHGTPPCSVCLLALAVLIGRVRAIRCTLLISRCCIWQTGNTNSSTSSHLLVARTKSDYRLILFVIITYLLKNAIVQICTSVLEPEQVNKVRLKR